MKEKFKSPYSLEERLRIVKEYESGTLSLREMNEKYGLHSSNMIPTWRKRYLKESSDLEISGRSSTFVSESPQGLPSESVMKKQTPEELEAEIQRLTKELEWARLQNKALNTLIDIAESQGIRIRKKSGAKQ